MYISLNGPLVYQSNPISNPVLLLTDALVLSLVLEAHSTRERSATAPLGCWSPIGLPPAATEATSQLIRIGRVGGWTVSWACLRYRSIGLGCLFKHNVNGRSGRNCYHDLLVDCQSRNLLIPGFADIIADALQMKREALEKLNRHANEMPAEKAGAPFGHGHRAMSAELVRFWHG
jgi:hypothetical protein